jgi:hypothetical protein
VRFAARNRRLTASKVAVPHSCQMGADRGRTSGHPGDTHIGLDLDQPWCRRSPIHLCTQGVGLDETGHIPGTSCHHLPRDSENC